jgi:antitoxin CcdA
MTSKRRISVSLDDELVAELESSDEAPSARVNDALKAELVRRRRHRLLEELLDELDARHGPVDRERMDKYVALLR